MNFATPPSSAAHRLTVLLPAEQDPWLETVRALLAPQGVQMLTARTGREALAVMESTTVHVAVLDHRMPQLGGLQVIKLVREHLSRRPAMPGGIQPATILLAESLSTALLHEALGQSVFTVLAKPVNHDQLLDALARAMRRFHNSQWPAPPAADQ